MKKLFRNSILVISFLFLLYFWYMHTLLQLFDSPRGLNAFDYVYRWLIIISLVIFCSFLISENTRTLKLNQRIKKFLIWFPIITSNFLVFLNLISLSFTLFQHKLPYFVTKFDVYDFIWFITGFLLVVTFPFNLVWNTVNLYLRRKYLLTIVTIVLLSLCIIYLQTPLSSSMQGMFFD